MLLFGTVWLRASLPRLRYDQLMAFGWKVLLPLATLNVLVGGLKVTDYYEGGEQYEVHLRAEGESEVDREYLAELIGSYPDYVEALNKRAMLYYNMKRYDEALVDLNAVLDNEPRHFGALLGCVGCWLFGEIGRAHV